MPQHLTFFSRHSAHVLQSLVVEDAVCRDEERMCLPRLLDASWVAGIFVSRLEPFVILESSLRAVLSFVSGLLLASARLGFTLRR